MIASDVREKETDIDDDEADAAERFYCGVLGGRQVQASRCVKARGNLWFLVEGTLVKTGHQVSELSSPVPLRVDDPDRVATRCWNAGFTVRAEARLGSGAELTLVDPFGLNIDLIAREPAWRP